MGEWLSSHKKSYLKSLLRNQIHFAHIFEPCSVESRKEKENAGPNV